MKKIFVFLLLLAIFCMPSYAQIWEGSGGNGIDEGISFGGSGGGGWTPDPLDPNATHYTITFKDNDDTTNLFSPIELNANTVVDLSVFVPTSRTGYTFSGWEDSNDDIVTSVTMTSNITVTASWSTNIWNLTLTDDSGTNVISKAYGAAITETPTARAGYSAWWVPSLPATMPDSNLSATAEYTNVTKNLITIVDGVSTTYTYGVGQPIDIADPTKAGYHFTGWNPSLPSVMPNEDITVTAVFTETMYTVYYRNTDQSIYATQVYAYNDEIVEPAEPTYTNDYFWDWQNLPDEMPPATITVDAVTFPKSTTVYGLEADLDAAASSTAYTYLYDAVNMLPIRVDSLNNFSNFNDNATSWKKFIYQYIRPCMLKLDGTVDYYLDRDDQSKKDDGVTASDISNSAYEGNAMVEFTKLWSNAKRIRGTNKYRLIISTSEIPDITFAEAFKRDDGTYADKVYYGMFNASYSNSQSRSCSLSADSIDTTGNINTIRSRVLANGSGWDITYEALTQHIYKILFMVSKTVEPYGALFNKDNITATTGVAYDNRSYGVENGCFFVKSLVSTNKLIKLLWIVDTFGSRELLQIGFGFCQKKAMYKNPPFGTWGSTEGYIELCDLSNDTGWTSSNDQIYYTRLSFYKGIAYESKFSKSQPSNCLGSVHNWFGINYSYRNIQTRYFMPSYRNCPYKLDRTTDTPLSISYHHCGYNGNSSLPNPYGFGYRISYIAPPVQVSPNISLNLGKNSISVQSPLTEEVRDTASSTQELIK